VTQTGELDSQLGMADESSPAMLEAPAVAALKETAAGSRIAPGAMERSVSMDIKEEREDLKRAAEESLNAIMDLNLDGTIKFMSSSWQQLTGIDAQTMMGKRISDYIYEHKTIFADTVESIRKDDSKSRIIRFAVELDSPTSSTDPLQDPSSLEGAEGASAIASEDFADRKRVVLEAQGIMVYDRSTGDESHVSDVSDSYETMC